MWLMADKREIWIERTGPDGKPKLFGPYATRHNPGLEDW
jgi:hypothetical protein